MTSKSVAGLFALLLLGLGACVQPVSFYESSLPAPDWNKARIFFFRDRTPDEVSVATEIYLGQTSLGVAEAGGISYRDVAPGTYEVSAAAPYFGPTVTKTLTVTGGQVVYVAIQTTSPDTEFGMGNGDSYGPFMSFVAPELARPVIAQLRYNGLQGKPG